MGRIKGSFIIIGFIIFIVFFNTVYGSENVLSDNYNVLWNANDIPSGGFSEYNGLIAVGDGITVNNSSRTYNNTIYFNTIKTNGSASVNNNCIPNKRALKFTVAQPCYITIRAYGTSSNTNEQPMYISKSGTVVAQLNLLHSELSENTVFLNSADTYYIYCLTGSVGICFINVHKIQGDLNLDTAVDKDDLTILHQMLYSKDGYSNDILDNGDINKDGAINDQDLICLNNLVANAGNYVPTYLNDKTWNIDNYYSDECVEYTEQTYIDGLEIIPAPINSENNVYINKMGEKYNNGIAYNSFIKTSGGTTYNNDNTIKGRGIGFFTSGPCCVTFFVRVANEGTNNNLTVSAKNRIVKQCELLDSVQQGSSELQSVTVYLDKPDEYFVGDTVGGLYLYLIKLTPLTFNVNNLSQCSMEVYENQSFAIMLDGNDLDEKIYNYVLNFDESMLQLEKITTQSRLESVEIGGINASGNVVEVINLYGGGRVLSIDNNTSNWSGAVALLEFKALDTGSVTIECRY